MYYIVSTKGCCVWVAYVKQDGGYGYQTRAFSLLKYRLPWYGNPTVAEDDLLFGWYPHGRRGAESSLYNDAQIRLCFNPKTFGKGKCFT